MKELLKGMVVGTSIEPFARKVQSLFLQVRGAKNTLGVDDKNRLYDVQTIKVMKLVLKKDSNCIDVGCHKGSNLKGDLDLRAKGNPFRL